MTPIVPNKIGAAIAQIKEGLIFIIPRRVKSQ
jgi:hypothetical protein